VRREFKAGRISISTALRAFAWLTRYHLGHARVETAIDQAVGSLEGQDEQTLIDRTAEFYKTDVVSLFRPGALQCIEQHRDNGDQLVLLTTSSSYLSKSVSQDLKLDEYLCNHFEVTQDGRYTGKLRGTVCYGSGKLILAREYLAQHQGRLEDSFFYTDSVSDLPVLEAVAHPRVVAPDRRLKKIAVERAWPILDWGR